MYGKDGYTEVVRDAHFTTIFPRKYTFIIYPRKYSTKIYIYYYRKILLKMGNFAWLGVNVI